MSSIPNPTDSTDVKSTSSLIKILVATDIHLGYGEENQILGKQNFYINFINKNKP